MGSRRIALLAFAHAGALGQTLARLTDHLSVARATLHDYPGHGTRIREPLLTDLRVIAADAVARHRALFDEEFLLLGHSMGAHVAFLVTELLRDTGRRLPTALIVTGASGPQHRTDQGWHLLSDEELLEQLDALGGGLPPEVRRHQELIDLVLPILRADIHAVATHEATESLVLDVPMVIARGVGDIVTREQAIGWTAFTRAQTEYLEVPGSHFFPFGPDAVEAARAIDGAIRRLIG